VSDDQVDSMLIIPTLMQGGLPCCQVNKGKTPIRRQSTFKTDKAHSLPLEKSRDPNLPVLLLVSMLLFARAILQLPCHNSHPA
jgi:hypothetical protein